MILYEFTLKFKPKDWENFYDGRVSKSKHENVKIRRSHLLATSIAFALTILILMSNPVIQLVFVSIISLSFGLYHLTKLFQTVKKFNIAERHAKTQVSEYLRKHRETQTMSLKVTDREIQYFENEQLISTHSWNDLTDVVYRDDHFELFIGQPTTNILIPKFAVSHEFYQGMMDLTKSKSTNQ